MKTLDVNLLQDGLQRNMAMLERLETEVSNISDSIKGLVAMEEALKGAGGSAIRNFYSEVHLPFLNFFLVFAERFKQQLQHIEAALTSLEPDTAGHILEQFLEGELEQGLTQIGTLTERFTNDANSIMETVSDIVALPPLDDSEVQEGVQNSKKKRDNTITDLHQFDTSQTTSLSTVEQNLQELGLWIVLMDGMFGAGVKVTSFQSNQWKAITFGSGIRTELFPKVYLDPNNLWVEEYEELIGTTINANTFETLEGMKVSLIEENVGENIKYHAYANGLLIKETVDGGKSTYEVVSEVIYKENDQVDAPQENKVLDGIQLGLDILGLIPVVGEVADGVNGIIYTARGDMLNAGLSFGSMIPFVGWGTTGAKFVNKGNDLYQSSVSASKNTNLNNTADDILVDTYANLRNNKEIPGQAHHLNQDAAFRDFIPRNEGLSIKLEGNIFRDIGSPHYNAHESLEQFWDNYRKNGEHAGFKPNLSEYNNALKDSLKNAGLSDEQADRVIAEAAKQQRNSGLLEDDFIPRIPGRINLPKP